MACVGNRVLTRFTDRELAEKFAQTNEPPQGHFASPPGVSIHDCPQESDDDQAFVVPASCASVCGLRGSQLQNNNRCVLDHVLRFTFNGRSDVSVYFGCAHP